MGKQTLKTAFLFAIALTPLLVLQVEAQPSAPIGKITSDVTISFRKAKLSANLTYEYVALEGAESAVKFYLGEEFNVKKVKCKTCHSFHIDRQTSPAPTLVINLKEPLPKGARLPIEIGYEGTLQGIYHKEHEFLELGLDYFWFPIYREFGRFNFTYRVSVQTDEPDFQLVGNGQVARRGSSWLIESKVPDSDIDLVFGKNLGSQAYRQDGYDLQVVSKSLPDSIPAALLGDIREALEFYNSSFGSNAPQRQVTAVIRPFPLIEGQGGYFRKGYFIIPRPNGTQDTFFTVAHELAHYWWLGANQQNAWLNESFAEYSAMLALRKLRGVDAYNDVLHRKRQSSADLPPIYGFDRTKNRAQSPQVLYVKGPVKLSELESEMGEQQFIDFLRKVAAEKIKDTDGLLEVLARASSREIAERFLRKLKE